MAGPGAPSVAEFVAHGVRRISLGTAIAQAAYSKALEAAREVLDHGTYEELADIPDFGELNSKF
jgi:2-methylisocitrate lyase-like PEP mutase family enzyme